MSTGDIRSGPQARVPSRTLHLDCMHGPRSHVPEMVERPVSMPDREPVTDAAGNVLLRERDRPLERPAQREVRGEGSGEGAAGAVRVPARDALDSKFDERLAVVEEI